ncbi:hypothetical protein [Dryocola clanedunensis]
MSAKARFLQKLQDKQTKSGPYNTKAQADIAEFQLRMSQLQASMEVWLEGTDIHPESRPVSLVEFLIGGKTFEVPGISLRYENKVVKFTPVFLYGHGVTGCAEVTLLADGSVIQLCRLFMREGKSSCWTWRPAGNQTAPGGAFDENVFFSLLERSVS